MEELLNQLSRIVSTLEETAPHVWEITVKQVMNEAQVGAGWITPLWILAGILLALGIFVFVIGIMSIECGDGGAVTFGVLLIMLACALGAMAISTRMEYTKMTSNPEWYAIQYLIKQIK